MALHLGGRDYDGFHSKLFMFVGTKDTRPYRTGLRKNGLDNGRLFVLESGSGGPVVPERRPLTCRWVAVPDELVPNRLIPVEWAPNHSVVLFDGLVAGAFDKTNPNRFFFATQGQGDPDGNFPAPFGRLFELTLGADPRGDCVMKRVYDFEGVVNSGQDIALSPNHLETRGDYLFVSDTRAVATPIVNAVRPNSIWTFKISDSFSSLREGQLDHDVIISGDFGFPTLGGVAGWRVEGILDASSLLNRPDAFFTLAQLPFGLGTRNVRDGQLLLMFKTDL